jgi:hypothetical protein
MRKFRILLKYLAIVLVVIAIGSVALLGYLLRVREGQPRVAHHPQGLGRLEYNQVHIPPDFTTLLPTFFQRMLLTDREFIEDHKLRAFSAQNNMFSVSGIDLDIEGNYARRPYWCENYGIVIVDLAERLPFGSFEKVLVFDFAANKEIDVSSEKTVTLEKCIQNAKGFNGRWTRESLDKSS